MAQGRRNGKRWFQREVGGMPHWGTLTVLAVFLLMAITMVFGRPDTTPSTQATPTNPPSSSPTTESTTPPDEPQEPVALFLGDSYTAGTGSSDDSSRWSSLVSSELDWDEVNQAQGGTGYISTSGVDGCGREYCPPYREVLDDLSETFTPDVVLVAGGQNDFDNLADNGDAVSDAIGATYDEIRSRFPDARLIAVGPSVLGPVSDIVIALDAEVQDAAATVDAEYVSMIDPPVLEPDMDTGDGAHVGNAGHQAIADRVLQAIN